MGNKHTNSLFYYQKNLLYPYVIDLAERRDESAITAFLEAQGDKKELKRLENALKKRDEEADLYANVHRDVFVCHSHEDIERIKPLIEKLESEQGWSFWYSERNLPLDVSNYKENIEKAIANCEVFLVFSSQLCMASADVNWELDVADALGKTKRLQYRLEDRNNNIRFKHFFNELGIQWINGFEEDNYELLAKRIYELLKQKDATSKHEPISEQKPSANSPFPASGFDGQEEQKLHEEEEGDHREEYPADFNVDASNNLIEYIGNEKHVVVPKGIKSIGAGAFAKSPSIETVAIPSTVISIGNEAFGGTFVKRIDVQLQTRRDWLNLEGKEHLKADEIHLFDPEWKEIISFSVPEGTTEIGSRAFSNCTSLVSVHIPGSVTSIGDYAFQDCTSLTSIDLPDSINEIAFAAFCGCEMLSSVHLPRSLTSIGYRAFAFCSNLESLTIPPKVDTIIGEAFINCVKLKSVIIPASVTNMGYHLFPNNNILLGG